MHKLLTRGSTLAAALVFSACSQDATAPAAVAGSGGSGNDTQCTGFLPPGTYDNIVVPPGAFCLLENSTVNGSVKALENSTLSIFGRVTVHGNVDGDKADIVDMLGIGGRNLVLGSIQIKEGGSTGGFSYARVCGTDLPNGNIQIEKMKNYVLVGGPRFCNTGNTLAKGNIKVEENSIGFPVPFGEMEVSRNTVGGNVQVFKNVGPGLKFVQGNTVREDLQCFENTLPFVGGPNTAGKAEGQCF